MKTSPQYQGYVINLDSARDRLDSFLLLSTKYNRVTQRVEAVSTINSDLSGNRYVSESVAACWESHRKVFRLFLETNFDYALIQEDDSIMKGVNLQKIVHAMSSNDIDFIQIGFLYGTFGRKIEIFGKNLWHFLLYSLKFASKKISPRSDLILRPTLREILSDHPFLVPADIRAGTHAYVVSRHFARNVLEMNSPIVLAADDFYMALSRMRSFAMYRFFCSRADQGSWESSVVPKMSPGHYS
jgi:GR25 family glycosyltransferase involved in LPS biosynthesis